jgi:hypothetical protein
LPAAPAALEGEGAPGVGEAGRGAGEAQRVGEALGAGETEREGEGVGKAEPTAGVDVAAREAMV